MKKIAPESILAMGDAENDLDMLEFAGVGIATANASKGLLEKFPNVSEWTHDEDAVYRELDRIFTFRRR